MRNRGVNILPCVSTYVCLQRGRQSFQCKWAKRAALRVRNSATDQKPTLGSTGDLLLFLSTASVSNSLLGTQVSGTPGVLLQHSHPFPLPGKSLQDKGYESYFTDRETEAADKEAERKPAALSSNPYDSHWAWHCHFLTSRRVLCMENQECKHEALLTSPRREDAWILHC